MAQVDQKIEGMYQEVLKRNPGETEFHQAVLEVLEWNCSRSVHE